MTEIKYLYEDDDIADRIDADQRTQRLYQLIEQMEDQREQQIVILRYGLYNTKPLTQQQVARRLGISRSYVSRIEKRVLERLRSQLT